MSSGVPPCAATTMSPMSSLDRSIPMPRIRYCCSPCSRKLPPAFALPRPSAVNTCCSGTLYDFIRAVFTVTSYCLMKPPKLTTSATPGIILRLRLITQSWMARSSAALRPSPRTR
jgi:hypothetical protein